MLTFGMLILSFSSCNTSNALETVDLFLEGHLKTSKAKKWYLDWWKKCLKRTQTTQLSNNCLINI